MNGEPPTFVQAVLTEKTAQKIALMFRDIYDVLLKEGFKPEEASMIMRKIQLTY